MINTTHARILLMTAFAFAGSIAVAQNISKVSCSQLCEKLMTPANTMNDASTRCVMKETKPSAENFYKPLNEELQNLLKANSTPNAETNKRIENAKQLNEQMQKDNVQNMTDAQKEEYAKKNLAGKQDMPSQATMDFAEKMKDPAFKEKFQKMTNEEKVAYMKSNGVIPPQNQNAVSRDPAIQKTQALFAQKMQDPAFRAEWKKMSESEKDACMKKLMEENNVDMNKIGREARAEGAKAPDKPVLSEMMPVSIKTFQDANAFMSNHQLKMRTLNEQVDAKHQSINEEAKSQLKSLPLIKGGEGAYHDPEKVKVIMAATMKKHLAQAEQDLKTLMDTWNSDRAGFGNLVKTFDTELAKINYGDDVKLPAEKTQLNILSSYQSSLITNLLQLLSESQLITERAADWTMKNKQFEKGGYAPVNDAN
ncbi:MAG: hypothetical protein ACHQK8_06080 [Bacteroidia bacterium]